MCTLYIQWMNTAAQCQSSLVCKQGEIRRCYSRLQASWNSPYQNRSRGCRKRKWLEARDICLSELYLILYYVLWAWVGLHSSYALLLSREYHLLVVHKTLIKNKIKQSMCWRLWYNIITYGLKNILFRVNSVTAAFWELHIHWAFTCWMVTRGPSSSNRHDWGP